MKRAGADVVLWMFASPVYFVRACVRTWRHCQFLNVARIPEIVCECGEELSLVGLWRCSCGFTYQGHLLRLCPVCGSLPQVVRCYCCGVTTKLPEP
jgi:hypothetical protein